MEVEEQIYRRKTNIKLSRDVNHFVGCPESQLILVILSVIAKP